MRRTAGLALRAGGFTLIEVLVALAIVAVGMAAVLSALSSSASTVSYLRDKTFAQWVALNQISTLRLSGQIAPVGNSDGDVDFGGRSWHWRREVVATEVPGVVRIDVKVRPAEIKGNEDNDWFTTVSGIQGDAVGIPNGYQPDWGTQQLPGQGPQGPGSQTGAPGSQTPGAGNAGAGATAMPGFSSQAGTPGTLGGTSGTLGGPDTLGSPSTPPTPPPQSDPSITPDSSQ